MISTPRAPPIAAGDSTVTNTPSSWSAFAQTSTAEPPQDQPLLTPFAVAVRGDAVLVLLLGQGGTAVGSLALEVGAPVALSSARLKYLPEGFRAVGFSADGASIIGSILSQRVVEFDVNLDWELPGRLQHLLEYVPTIGRSQSSSEVAQPGLLAWPTMSPVKTSLQEISGFGQLTAATADAARLVAELGVEYDSAEVVTRASVLADGREVGSAPVGHFDTVSSAYVDDTLALVAIRSDVTGVTSVQELRGYAVGDPVPEIVWDGTIRLGGWNGEIAAAELTASGQVDVWLRDKNARWTRSGSLPSRFPDALFARPLPSVDSAVAVCGHDSITIQLAGGSK